MAPLKPSNRITAQVFSRGGESAAGRPSLEPRLTRVRGLSWTGVGATHSYDDVGSKHQEVQLHNHAVETPRARRPHAAASGRRPSGCRTVTMAGKHIVFAVSDVSMETDLINMKLFCDAKMNWFSHRVFREHITGRRARNLTPASVPQTTT